MLYPKKPSRPQLVRGRNISQGLVGAWLFNEGGGGLTREAVYGGQAATINGPTWATGEPGSVLDFTNNTYVDTLDPVHYQFADGKFTTVFRVKPGSCSTHHGFISTLNYGANTGYLCRSEGNTTNYRIVIGSTLYDLGAGIALNANVWMTLALTWISGGAVTSYLDGKYVASVNIKAIASSGLNLYFGKEQAVNYGFVGQMDAVLIYDRILATNELLALSRDIYAPFRLRRNRWALTAGVVPGTTTIRLTWNDNSQHEDGFSIERSVDGGAYSEIDTVGEDTETYDDADLEIGHTYTYRIRATSAELGNSEYSDAVSIEV